MLGRMVVLFALILTGAGITVIAAPRLGRLGSERLARGFLIAVTSLMAVRVVAYVVSNVFGVTAVRPLSTGPYDLTNLLIGGVYGLALAHTRGQLFEDLWREPNLLLALRLSAGVAFVLAGLVNVFLMDSTGTDYFVDLGYTKTFHRFIMTAEVLGGAALLLPWPWLTLISAAGLSIDMFGALYTLMRSGDALDAAAVAMVLRLLPLVVLIARGRWVAVVTGALVCAVIAIAGSILLYHPRAG
jgi:uncharacterized membrane protein YphA (DoxX/SURF4 family)